ncbi:MAG TPA: CAP domain-containing protein [Candidatus Paceibacterota bacterium]|nr:CAP domain-containing protein [Candidatus Paceibacterota bacterium]
MKRSFFLAILILFFFSPASTAQAQSVAIEPEEIFKLTNEARRGNAKKLLVWDAKLARIAEEKLDDMFERGYFAHKDPDGKTAGARAKAARYQYSLLGENLALGWYEDTEMLVDAWMESSGHRKNILFDNFTAIGVAVGTRQFDGEATMIAIQLFARPSSACKAPSSELAQAIVIRKTYAERLNGLMNAYVKEAGGASNRSVRVLTNQMTAVMSLLLREVDDTVRAYNRQVEDYELCRRGE